MGNKKSEKKEKSETGMISGHIGAIKLTRESFEFQLSGKKSGVNTFTIDAKEVAFFTATVAIVTSSKACGEKISVEVSDTGSGAKILRAVGVGNLAAAKKKSASDVDEAKTAGVAQVAA
jgi:hypothetical protein